MTLFNNTSTSTQQNKSTAKKTLNDSNKTTLCPVCKKRRGKVSCSQQSCSRCCSDPDCEGHRDLRESAKLKESILNGTSLVNRLAARKRALAVRPGYVPHVH
mmetsp:Transcript_8600/g.12256  ORF Transcript_8600/g.12256 Transcript_8600/m.12256 type:complete len:102 (+) Transcript_8600:70-375(+)